MGSFSSLTSPIRSTGEFWSTSLRFPRPLEADSFACSDPHRVFSELAISLVRGPLSETAVHLMKVSPRKMNGKDDSELYFPPFLLCRMTRLKSLSFPGHLICLYVSDVYQKESLAAVLRVLAEDHGEALLLSFSSIDLLFGILIFLPFLEQASSPPRSKVTSTPTSTFTRSTRLVFELQSGLRRS